MADLTQVFAIAQQFIPHSSQNGQAKILDIKPFGSGNINDTFLVSWVEPQHDHAEDGVETENGFATPSPSQFVLQRINTHVFRQPQLVMQNIRVFTEHGRDRLSTLHQRLTPAGATPRRWEIPHVLPTAAGQDHWIAEDGSFWRSLSLIHQTQSFDILHSDTHAQEVGYALGMFHSLISDLPPQHLSDTLEGFHITPAYLHQYEAVVQTSTIPQSPEVKYGMQFVRDRAAFAHVLETAKAAGKLPLRLMHGDPKINNILFDTVTQHAVSVIDLDTVKPGLVHYDIGDCLRSGCNLLGEETQDWQAVQFDSDRCQQILRGYLAVAHTFLTPSDYAYLYDAIRLITFELGLRFFTDHLAGNVYFKANYPEHNLARALVQFQLTASIEAQAPSLRALIQDLTPTH